jgi:hypothetical protein
MRDHAALEVAGDELKLARHPDAIGFFTAKREHRHRQLTLDPGAPVLQPPVKARRV